MISSIRCGLKTVTLSISGSSLLIPTSTLWTGEAGQFCETTCSVVLVDVCIISYAGV